jgi:pantoate--beta-alanine ligase
MLIFNKTKDLQAYIGLHKSKGKTIGFVPTMGALHLGHLSLIDSSQKKCDITICSIFVNPTQFNDKKDLECYPRTIEKDTAMLEKKGCHVLFIPLAEEVYPEKTKEIFDFGILNKVLEGKFRTGHFNGVAQVVKRFFEIIKPDFAFFGSKDYQQVMIVKALVEQMHSSIEILACPILREKDGLAMSSRNALLNAEERRVAGLIPALLQKAKDIAQSNGIKSAKAFIAKETNLHRLMKLEYYEICDAETLNILSTVESRRKSISLIALYVGKIRLIDNIPIN